jgi:hypothetical protein
VQENVLANSTWSFGERTGSIRLEQAEVFSMGFVKAMEQSQSSLFVSNKAGLRQVARWKKTDHVYIQRRNISALAE